MRIEAIEEAARWDDLVATHPQGHPLQSWGWGEVKRAAGWDAWRVALFDGDHLRAAAQVLTRHVPRLPFTMLYVPRGPLIDPLDSEALSTLVAAIRAYGQRQGAIYLKIDPPWPAGTAHALGSARFAPSDEPIQVTDTYTIDLARPKDEILAAMRSKTRQYIRKAEKEGTTIIRDTTGDYLGVCYQIYQETSRRAHFGLHPRAYYDAIFQRFDPVRQYLYVAFREGQALAFLWMACGGHAAVELYGGVSDAGQDYKANYLLKWHAIQQMRAAGYTLYDLNGRLNEGISQFKEGFGPAPITWIGPYDRIFRPLLYSGWTKMRPLARKMLARAESGSTTAPQP